MAAALILNEFVDGRKIYTSFSEFITNTSVLGMTTGIVVGIGTYNMIRATTFDIVIPLLNWVVIGFVRFINMNVYRTLDRVLFRGMATFNGAHFIQEFIIWAVMLFVTYGVVKVFIERIAASYKKQED